MSDYDSFIQQITKPSDIEGFLNKNPKFKKDKLFFIYLLNEEKLDDESISFFDKSIAEDKSIALRVLDTWPLYLSYKFFSDELKKDKSVAQSAFEGNSANIEFFPEELRNDEDFVKDLINESHPTTPVLKFLPEKYRTNKPFLMALMKKDYQSFMYVSEELKSDEELVFAGMFGSSAWHAVDYVFRKAGVKVTADKDFVKKVLDKVKTFRDKKYIIDTIKEIYKEAIAKEKSSTDGGLAEVKVKIKNFKKVFETADSWENKKLKEQFQSFLKNEMADFLDDKKVLVLAIEAEFSDRFMYDKKISYVLDVSNKALLNDIDFCSILMKKTDGKVYQFLPKQIKENEDFFISNFSVSINKDNVPMSMRKNKDLLIKLFEKYPYLNVGYLVNSDLFNDKEFMKKALAYDGSLLSNASDEIKKDKGCVEIAISSNQNAFIYASPDLFSDKDLMIKSIKEFGTAFLDNLSKKERSDKGLLMDLIKADKETNRNSSFALNLMRIASDDLKKDKDLALQCVKQDGWAIEHLDESLKYDIDILKDAFNSGAHIYQLLDIDKLKKMYPPKELKKIMKDMYDYL